MREKLSFFKMRKCISFVVALFMVLTQIIISPLEVRAAQTYTLFTEVTSPVESITLEDTTAYTDWSQLDRTYVRSYAASMVPSGQTKYEVYYASFKGEIAYFTDSSGDMYCDKYALNRSFNYQQANNTGKKLYIIGTYTPKAPELSSVACTSVSNDDGKITGTTAEMEYSTTSDFSSATDCTDTETTVAAGTYYVRIKAMSGHTASASTQIAVAAYHAHNSSAYGSNATQHWTKCTDDNDNNGTPEAHAGGTATCQVQAVCSTCGASYGALASHNWGSWDSTTGTRSCQTSGCSATDTCDHSGYTTGICGTCGKDITPPPTHTHNSSAYGSNATQHWTKCTDDNDNNGTPADHTWADGVCSVCSYTCTHSGETGTCSVCGKDLGSTPPPAPTPTPDPAPAESAPEPKPDMTTVNIEGATFNTWEEITANTPNLTAEKLHKVNASNDDLLHVNIVGKEDKTVPVEAVKALDKSTITGLHVFIGESDAVTFLNNLDYSKYTGISFNHEDVIDEKSRTIDFTSKGKISATVIFHTLIAPNTKANVYKVVDGNEVFLATLSSNESGGFCFAIDELAKYVIKY